MELPVAFTDKMKNILGEEYGKYLSAMEEERRYGLRVNTLKITPEDLEDRLCAPLERMPFVDNGFYYGGDLVPSKHPYYAAGLYYLQEPSAMLPAACLPVERGDRVLDLCAAPGGKTTELGRRLSGTGFLLANDISRSRAKGLLKNMELWGIHNAFVTAETPERLSAAYPETFDKILVDAPCSGEGMFRKDGALMKSWIKRGPGFYHDIQCAVVSRALEMLKPGGMLLYSTCTFSPEEDEAVVQYMLDLSPSIRLLEIPGQEGFSPGRPDLIENGCGDLVRCVRIYPHRFRGEGHFLALLKKGDREHGGEQKAVGDRQADKRIPDGLEPLKGAEREAVSGFFQELSPGEESGPLLTGGVAVPDPSCMLKKDDYVCWLSSPQMYRSSLRYLRTGLLAGILKNGRFEPFQALAMALNGEGCKKSLSLPVSDGRVLRYLKGETLDISDFAGPGGGSARGYRLICADGFGLGWGKANGSLLKNKYAPGWRWQ